MWLLAKCNYAKRGKAHSLRDRLQPSCSKSIGVFCSCQHSAHRTSELARFTSTQCTYISLLAEPLLFYPVQTEQIVGARCRQNRLRAYSADRTDCGLTFLLHSVKASRGGGGLHVGLQLPQLLTQRHQPVCTLATLPSLASSCRTAGFGPAYIHMPSALLVTTRDTSQLTQRSSRLQAYKPSTAHKKV